MNLTQNDSLSETYDHLTQIARSFWPGIDQLSEQRRLIAAGDVIVFLYTFPFAIIGFVWLILSTDFQLLINQSLFLLLNFGLLILFSRLSFFLIVEIRFDRYGSSQDSLDSIVLWSTALLLGPSALWLGVIQDLIQFSRDWLNASNPPRKWILLREHSTTMAINTFIMLICLNLFVNLGGTFPLSDLELSTVSRAFVIQVVQLALVLVIVSGYLLYHIGVQIKLAGTESIRPLIRFFIIGICLPFVANPFAILLAGLYEEHGPGMYAFLMLGLLIVAFLARQLSNAAENSRQQSRQLEKLELLSRDLLEVIPDSTTLPEILEKHIPGMFPSGRVAIWIEPNSTLLDFPEDWPDVEFQTWNWIMHQSKPHAFLVNDNLPWNKDQQEHRDIVTAPIISSDSGQPMGGILLELRALAQAWDQKSISSLFPGLKALADYIASAVHQSLIYEDSLDFQRISQELKLAGRIQSSFLPNKFPPIPGWQLAVTLLPAREMSGDFFDVMELSDGRLGILVADVADKGVGSALYMALSRTLLRTYAEEYDADPDVVFFAANNRLLKDARANLFITIFYGILDPSQGKLTYCNAGHIPPFLVRSSDQGLIDSLTRTGMAMGVEANATWNTKTVQIDPGDVLIIYTDGIPDAQDESGRFFNDDRVINLAKQNSGRLAFEIQSAVIDEVQNFTGESPQIDDITLMVMIRDK